MVPFHVHEIRELRLTEKRRTDTFPCFFKGEKKREWPQSSRYCDTEGKQGNEKGGVVRQCRVWKEYVFERDRSIVATFFSERNTRIFTSNKLLSFEKNVFQKKVFLKKSIFFRVLPVSFLKRIIASPF